MLVCIKRLEKIKRIEASGVRRIKICFLKQPQSSAVAREWQPAERWPPPPIVGGCDFLCEEAVGEHLRALLRAGRGWGLRVTRGPPWLPAGGELGPPRGSARPIWAVSAGSGPGEHVHPASGGGGEKRLRAARDDDVQQRRNVAGLGRAARGSEDSPTASSRDGERPPPSCSRGPYCRASHFCVRGGLRPSRLAPSGCVEPSPPRKSSAHLCAPWGPLATPGR